MLTHKRFYKQFITSKKKIIILQSSKLPPEKRSPNSVGATLAVITLMKDVATVRKKSLYYVLLERIVFYY